MATEEIGFLPGTLEEKIHPYLKPLLDAIEDHVGVVKAKELLEKGLIEFCPLAFMRGRSINDAFVILDEAQNTTREQMKMFLTRMGYNSIFAINGDHTQSDLEEKSKNGLSWVSERLRGVSEDILITEFARRDIVRNPLIEAMLNRLDMSDAAVEESTKNLFEISERAPSFPRRRQQSESFDPMPHRPIVEESEESEEYEDDTPPAKSRNPFSRLLNRN